VWAFFKIELIRVCALLSPYSNWIRPLTEALLLSGIVKVTLIFLRAMTPDICLVVPIYREETVKENEVRVKLILYKNLTVIKQVSHVKNRCYGILFSLDF
jgi:hypothetical protein